MKHIVKGLVASAVLAAVAVGGQVSAEPVRGGTLVTVLGSNVRNLNSAVQSGIVTGYPGAQLFASPLRYDEDWTPQPYLAESWDVSDDGLTVTLNLVKNAKFHDGEPLTSEDVAFSVEVIKAKPYIDLEKMGVTGGSYGGYMTLWIIGHTHHFQAAFGVGYQLAARRATASVNLSK